MRRIDQNIKITINNLIINYNDNGSEDAPVVIFIHGFPFNSAMWNSQMRALQDTCRVISYDVRGHGGSDEGDEEFSINLFVSDLLNLMDALKINKAVLCGLSMGGYIVLNAIENHPELFSALVLCDTACNADSLEAKEKRAKAIENIKVNGVENYADENIKNLFAHDSFSTRKVEISQIREMILNTNTQTLFKTLRAFAERKETCSNLAEIKVPVLIMVGREDIVTPIEAASLMHEKINGSLLKVIEDAGHLSNLENPDEFNKQLRNFIASVYSSIAMLQLL